MQPLRRLAWVPALDGLRGLAVLIVVAYHADALWSSWSGETFELLRPVGGFIGVDLFFVLSGFLLTALLLDRSRGGVKVLDFYLRRALRLVPGVVFALVVYSAVTVRTGEWDLRQVLVSASFLGNWSWKWPDLAMPFALGHLWSVATEAQMYVVWPFLTTVTTLSVRTRRVLIVYGALLAIVVLNRYRLWHAGFPAHYIYQRTDTRADSMLVGGLAAQLWCRGAIDPRSLRWLLAPVLAVITWLMFNAQFVADSMVTVGYTLVAMAFALVLLVTLDGSTGWWNRLMTCTPLRWMGRLSYGVYLWHLPAFVLVSRHWSADSRAQFAVAVAVVVAGVSASWSLVERPVLRLKAARDAAASTGASQQAYA